MTDQPGVTWIPNQNFFPGRNGVRPRYVIVHGTAGGTSAAAIGTYFASTQNTANPVSSHYIIGSAGEIVQTVLEENGAWGNGAYSAGHAAFWDTTVNPNNLTISVEFCKPALDNSSVLTAAQVTSGIALISGICKRWNIPMQDADGSGGITGHFSIDPVNRSNCPGPFPWAQIWGGNQVTQEQYDALYKKYVAVCGSYDAVVKEKNSFIPVMSQQKAEIALLQQQLAAAKAPYTQQVQAAVAILNKLIN